jgi:hypothetical protein
MSKKLIEKYFLGFTIIHHKHNKEHAFLIMHHKSQLKQQVQQLARRTHREREKPRGSRSRLLPP